MGSTLRVSNLPKSATEEDLVAKFARCGSVESATIITDTTPSKRYGLIVMSNSAEAQTAVQRLNMTQFEDSIMSVSRVRESQ